MTQPTRKRQIILDTETTGLEHSEGHRVIEIGCVEMINRRKTLKNFHIYLNPDREIDASAIEVHGITNQFLKDKPRFKDIAKDLVDYLTGAEVIIHNAPFDVGFLNNEFEMLGYAPQTMESLCEVFDSLAYARTRFPGMRNSLDGLCRRFEIDNSHRDYHGALLDAEILTDCYLAMTGGQSSLLDDEYDFGKKSKLIIERLESNRPQTFIRYCSDQEIADHQSKLKTIHRESGQDCLWLELEPVEA